MAHIEPCVECNKRARKIKKKIKKMCEEDKWHVRKVGGSFPHFDQLGRREIKRDKKE